MSPANRASPAEPGDYRGRRIAVGTRHGKADQFAPAFADVLGAVLVTPPDLDTDRFGTFPGDVPRTMTALDTARAKARLAIEATGLGRGLASEASYGPLPGSGLPGHEELLVFIDAALGIEVTEGYRTTATPGPGHRAAQLADLPAAATAELPGQGLIVRPAAGGRATDIVKGITTPATLADAISRAAQRSADGLALVEPDLRAHHNPTRRVVLRRLADAMAHRLATRCPMCRTPGYGRIDSVPGLPCRACDAPTPLRHKDVHGCPSCRHRESGPVEARVADPQWCPECNP